MLSHPNRRRIYASHSDEQITKQSHKAECDINNILSQFKRTGIISHLTNNQPQYTDLPDSLDYQQSLNLILSADEAFASLPSTVRRYFDNDPAQLLAALEDPSQREKLTELGILAKPPGDGPRQEPSPLANPPVTSLSTDPTLP